MYHFDMSLKCAKNNIHQFELTFECLCHAPYPKLYVQFLNSAQSYDVGAVILFILATTETGVKSLNNLPMVT